MFWKTSTNPTVAQRTWFFWNCSNNFFWVTFVPGNELQNFLVAYFPFLWAFLQLLEAVQSFSDIFSKVPGSVEQLQLTASELFNISFFKFLSHTFFLFKAICSSLVINKNLYIKIWLWKMINFIKTITFKFLWY